jgi:hypothetical protein
LISTLLLVAHLPNAYFRHPKKVSLAVISSSLQGGWVWCSSWKYISFFVKIAVSLMFNPRASAVMVPANSILITSLDTVFIIEQQKHLTDVGRVI